LAGFLSCFGLVLALAEADDVAVLVAVALAVPDAVAVTVVPSPGLVLSPGLVPSPVPLSVVLLGGLLSELAGVSLGVTGLAGLAGADDAESVAHAAADALLWAAWLPLPAPPAAEPS
jgi:hypothetical protein